MYRYPHHVSFPTTFSSYLPHHPAWYPHPYSQVFSHWPTGQQGGMSPYPKQGGISLYPKQGGVSPYPTPYPKPSPFMKPPSLGIPSIMSQFKTSEGTYDINKMMDTMGQMINTMNQVGGMLKGLVNTFKV